MPYNIDAHRSSVLPLSGLRRNGISFFEKRMWQDVAVSCMSDICLSHNAHTPKDVITIYLKAFVVFGAIFVPDQLRKTTQLSLS